MGYTYVILNLYIIGLVIITAMFSLACYNFNPITLSY